jgi:hypothetical protein
LLRNQSPFNSSAHQEGVKPVDLAVQEPPAEPGVYYRSGVDWIRLSPASAIFEGKVVGFFMGRVTSAKVYDGAHAKPQAAELKPEFYVRGFQVLEQQIRIVRLETKTDRRMVQINSDNLRRPYEMYRPSDVHAAPVTRVSNSVYKITPASDLPSGEYALILYASYSRNGEYSEKGEYEFGITLQKKN